MHGNAVDSSLTAFKQSKPGPTHVEQVHGVARAVPDNVTYIATILYLKLLCALRQSLQYQPLISTKKSPLFQVLFQGCLDADCSCRTDAQCV